jgi:hypothetical protein
MSAFGAKADIWKVRSEWNSSNRQLLKNLNAELTVQDIMGNKNK